MSDIYTKTSVKDISKTLTNLMRGFGDDQAGFEFTASKNFILFVPQDRQLEEAQKLLDAIVEIYPAKFFLVYLDDQLNDYNIGVTARCHILTKNRHSCAEIIRFGSPRNKLTGLPSLIRSQMLPGLDTEIFGFGLDMRSLESLTLLNPLADRIMFDSSQFNLSLIKNIWTINKKLVDFDWVRFAVWREEISSIFQKNSYQALIPQLERIVIQGSSNPTAYLAAGWILGRLGLQVSAFGNNEYECAYEYAYERLDRDLVALQILSDPNVTLKSISFVFKNGAKVVLENMHRLVISAQIDPLDNDKLSRSKNFDDQSLKACFARYLAIGESFKDYSLALERAFELETLAQSYF